MLIFHYHQTQLRRPRWPFCTRFWRRFHARFHNQNTRQLLTMRTSAARIALAMPPAIVLAIAMASAVLVAVPAAADQNAPQLEALFTRLGGDLAAPQAVAVTSAIWAAWRRHDDAQVRASMAAGGAAIKARKWAAAATHFSAAIARAPKFAEAWNKRATVHYLRGDFAASAADVTATLNLESRHFGALAGQGMMHMQMRKNALALIYFRRALAINPHMDNVRRHVARLSRRLGKPI